MLSQLRSSISARRQQIEHGSDHKRRSGVSSSHASSSTPVRNTKIRVVRKKLQYNEGAVAPIDDMAEEESSAVNESVVDKAALDVSVAPVDQASSSEDAAPCDDESVATPVKSTRSTSDDEWDE